MKFYSDVTKKMYDTAAECEAQEAAFLKAEEEKRNGNKAAIAEIDLLFEQFQKEQKAQEEAYKAVIKTGHELHKKYAEYQRKYGQLPEKHYLNYILTRMI
jgi:hypothetical protein